MTERRHSTLSVVLAVVFILILIGGFSELITGIFH